MAKQKSRFANEVRKIIYFLLANGCYAFAIQLFLAGNNIAAGGFSGIAIVLSSFLPVSIGTFVFLLNIPFIILAFFIKGPRYTLLTLCGSTENKLVAAVFGGLIYGVGAVLFLKSGASNGGTDLVARLLLIRFRSMSVGKMFLIVDGSVVLFAMLMFRDIEAGIYAIITIYVCGMVNDRILNGFDKANMCYIISDKDPVALSDAIQKEIHRGVTLQRGVGMYQGYEHNILMTVVRPRETYHLKEVVQGLDEKAFVVMAEVNEVLGRGFKGFADETPVDAPELPVIPVPGGKKKKKGHKKEKREKRGKDRRLGLAGAAGLPGTRPAAGGAGDGRLGPHPAAGARGAAGDGGLLCVRQRGHRAGPQRRRGLRDLLCAGSGGRADRVLRPHRRRAELFFPQRVRRLLQL